MKPHPSAMATMEFVGLAAIWGSSFLFVKLGAAEFGPVALAGLRVILAAVCLVPLLLRDRVRSDLRSRLGPILFVGLLNAGLPFLLFSFAVLHISTSQTSILYATVPLAGTLVAWIWLKEHPGFWRLTGLSIGFAGATALVLVNALDRPPPIANDGGDVASLLAMAACLLGSLLYGVSAVFAKRYLSGVDPLAAATGSLMGAALALLLPTIWFWPDTRPGAAAWAAVLAVAVVCTAGGYILLFRLIERIGPSPSLGVTYLTPVFTMLYGYLLLGEAITPWMIGCALLILLGTGLTNGLIKPAWRPGAASRSTGHR